MIGQQSNSFDLGIAGKDRNVDLSGTMQREHMCGNAESQRAVWHIKEPEEFQEIPEQNAMGNAYPVRKSIDISIGRAKFTAPTP